MIVIKVLNPETKKISGVSKASGKPYEFQTQQAYAYTLNRTTGKPEEIPERFELTLERDQAPYARGDYTIDPTSFYVSRNGRLELSPRLVALQHKAPSAAPIK